MAELVMVRVKSAAAAMLTDVKTAAPDLPFTTTGLAAAPDAVGELSNKPAPEALPTKFPRVAVIFPVVAVSWVKVPAAGVVPPIVPGAARRALRDAGFITTFVERRPATASALVANREMPTTVVEAGGMTLPIAPAKVAGETANSSL
jgi:hypothetical protein